MAMIHGSDPEDRRDFADFLSVLAFCLFGVFAVTATASALPLQLLDPSWQLRLSSSLIDNGPIAALGVVTAWLALILAPSSGPCSNRLRAIRRWAMAAALGYLLLIPLQATAAWRGLAQALTAERQEERVITARLTSLRQLVLSAPSLAALQGPWEANQGPPLSAADQSMPLPQLRARLLAQLQQLGNRLQASRSSSARQGRIWAVVQNTLRLCLSALLLGLGFAAAGQDRPGNPSLLQHWRWLWLRALDSLANLRQARRIEPRRARSPIARKGFEDSDYFDEITPRD